MQDLFQARKLAAYVIAAAGTPAWENERSGFASDIERAYAGEAPNLLALLDATGARIAGTPAADRDAVRREELDAWQPRTVEILRRDTSDRWFDRHRGRWLDRRAREWVSFAVAGESTRYSFRELTGEARTDFVGIARAAVALAPRVWSRARGIPMFWAIVDDDGMPRIHRHRGEINPDFYWDDRSTSMKVPGAVRKKLGDHRCVALIYGNAWANWRLPFMAKGDTAACVKGLHRSGAEFDLHVPFVRRWGRRIRLAPDAERVLASL